MLVSMSRTIGYSISPVVVANSGTGPTSIIWWTAGVSGIDAPAMRAMRGLQTPQQIATASARMAPRLVRTPRTRPFSTSIPRISVLGTTVSAPCAWACSRISVPARRESTTPTPGQKKPPRMTFGSRNGTRAWTSAGVSSSAGSPQALAEASRRFSSSRRSGVRATSTPPLWVKTPRARYCRTLSWVKSVISFE